MVTGSSQVIIIYVVKIPTTVVSGDYNAYGIITEQLPDWL